MANSFPSSHPCPSSLRTNVRDYLAHTSANTGRLSVCMLLLTKRCGLPLCSNWIPSFPSVLKAINFICTTIQRVTRSYINNSIKADFSSKPVIQLFSSVVLTEIQISNMIQLNEKSTPLGVKPSFQNALSKTIGKFTIMLYVKFEHRYIPHVSKVCI